MTTGQEQPDHKAEPAELVWLEELCDRFENAWRQGKPITIEFVLKEIAPARRSKVLKALLQLELALRTEAGNIPSLAELAERFPKDRQTVESVLQNSPPADSIVDQATIPPHNVLTPHETDDGAVTGPGSLRIPTQLDRYRILRKLGQGAMGSVFLAQPFRGDRA